MKQSVSTKFSARKIIVCVSAALASTSAMAIDFKAGDFDMSINGYLNGYYTHVSCSGSANVTIANSGLALGGKELGCGGKDGATNIGNGLLPNALITSFKTKQNGIDIGGTFMIGAAISSNNAIANNNNVDIRQSFLTFGTADMGTVKVGRDYGSFGSDAILSDMTLLGVGAPVQATQRNRVSLGHIGAGYSYLGHYGQITYKSPSMNGLTFSGGLYSPVDNGGNFESKNQPQVQLRLNYADAGFKGWAGVKTQKFYSKTVGTADFTMNGFEIGGSASFGDAGILANYQTGKGLGILADGDAGDQKQNNFLLQGTYKVTPVNKLGLGYGVSRMKDGTGLALKDNTNVTLGLYHSLTPSLTLVAELSRTESKAFNGEKAKANGVGLGAILFF